MHKYASDENKLVLLDIIDIKLCSKFSMQISRSLETYLWHILQDQVKELLEHDTTALKVQYKKKN